ncbi:Crp/Fnr family transcriptional regulator [Agrobacterium vitis]|uniref:Crp/Fnr family transcriptional regulator n=1 Tax=Agrobacterium vitis TaxID=373 RepID=UPI000872A95C|nr:Crp/Fnr family transcriptional regulator [Agrobacterium vitis]MCE6076807.1 helix-turn-helix domain-containing protein [Agrobacterium vitis]MCM2450112.1 Crp/Fnr family transcriptional regulator [Agrobacterium vitis]MCM2470859.1 Crp/Fnr family transcriptional regulator [Agrobacterium vitis]MUO71191.1 helix-turn-helix domain-containing protein [Agrobacterium vitis]MUO84345.1 helix-turn-helix domain-containing protein [Agrobacterium vitis]
MPDFDQSRIRNLLLGMMPPEAFLLLRPHMEAVDLPLKHLLVESNTVSRNVYFIEHGLASVVATTSDDEAIECGHIGFEGMAGAHVVLKTDRTPMKTFMQIAGSGIAVPVATLKDVLANVPAADLLLSNYVHTTEVQVACSALANGRYVMHERLARWILMCHDRIEGDDLPLTHEFLSLMLGVRRSGVTDELHKLEGMWAIKATRGNIHVRNRDLLEEIAGGCYGAPEDEYERLFGVSPRRR